MLAQDLDWYFPPRSPDNSNFGDPGDRFIPTRSLMNLDIARCSLRRKKTDSINSPDDSSPPILTVKEEYRRKLEENLMMDSEGKPFKILVFKGSPKTCRPQVRLLDEMMQQERDRANNVKTFRHIPKSCDKVLDAPDLVDDYYLNLIDWGQNNILVAALGSVVYLWNAESGKAQKLMETDGDETYPTSVAWSSDGKTLAVGLDNSQVQLWDAATSRQLRSLRGHSARVGSLAWNGNLITSGSWDSKIINHDKRENRGFASCLWGHTEEVCGLRWSGRGNLLASGGNDNVLHVWEAAHMASSSKFLFRFEDHCAAVKALAWCPHQSNILASGGGTADRCIKIWNTQTGQCLNTVDTKAQVCALEWNRHHKEILSAHGFSQNQLCLWRYPSMSKIGELTGHQSRILSLSQSPDGLTLVSAGADETIRLWKVFGPPNSASSKVEDKENSSPLSLNRLHIR